MRHLLKIHATSGQVVARLCDWSADFHAEVIRLGGLLQCSITRLIEELYRGATIRFHGYQYRIENARGAATCSAPATSPSAIRPTGMASS